MSFDSWRHLKAAHFWQVVRRRDRATDALKTALALDPSCVQAANELGHLYGSAGDYASAAEYLERARTLAPTDGDIAFNLGFVRERAAVLGG